jgi:hypothetical protein
MQSLKQLVRMAKRLDDVEHRRIVLGSLQSNTSKLS